MKYVIILVMLLCTLAGCSRSGWIQKNPVFVNSGVFMETIQGQNILVSEKLTVDVVESIRQSDADSLGRSTLQQMIDSYTRGNISSAEYVGDETMADYVIRIEEVDISWVPTVNMVHPGPMFKVTLTASAWIGQEKVFESSQSANANLAVVAADGRRFYIPSDEDKTNPEIQTNTIYPALRTAFGKVWQEFLQADKRR